MLGDMKIIGGTVFQEKLVCNPLTSPHSAFVPTCNQSSGLLDSHDRDFLKIDLKPPLAVSLPIAQLKDLSYYPDERPKKDYGNIHESDSRFTPGYIFPMTYAHDGILESLAERKARRAEEERMEFFAIDPDPCGFFKAINAKKEKAEEEKMDLFPDPLGLWRKK